MASRCPTPSVSSRLTSAPIPGSPIRTSSLRTCSEARYYAGVSPDSKQAARRILEGLQQGKIDRALFTSNANTYFNEQAISDFASSLGPLGALQEFTDVAQQNRGGMSFRAYRVKFGTKTISLTVRKMPDGTIEQYQVAAAD